MNKKMLTTSLLVTSLLMLFFGLAFSEIFYSAAVEQEKNRLITYMNFFDDTYPLDEGGAAAFSAKAGDCRVTIIDFDGRIIADSFAQNTVESHADRAEVIEAISTGEGFSMRLSATSNEYTLYYCRAFDTALIRLSIIIPTQMMYFLSELPVFLVFLFLDVMFCLIFTWLSTYYILQPVKELTQIAIGTNTEIIPKDKSLQPIADVINQKNAAVARAKTSKDEFISNVTHEMNTPLTSIHGFAELIESGSLSTKRVHDAAATILKQSERLSAMITQILHYSAIDDDTLESYDVNLSKLTSELVETFRPMLAEKNLSLETDIAPNVILSSRHERVTELLNNLIGNAIKYNKENGKITVTVKKGVLSVADTGIGIDKKEIKQIFSRFYTVDRSHGENKGFGLGLSIVKKLCEKAGWKLNVSSVLNEGTTFIVEL